MLNQISNCQEGEDEAKRKIRIHQTEVKVTYKDSANKFRKVEVQEPYPDSEHKVLLLVGESGAGKSTLINMIWNYIIGLCWVDDFRCKLIDDAIEDQNQAHTQTDWITAFTIHHDPKYPRAEYTLTIIDTPGFSSGLQRDREITNRIRHFINACGLMGIDRLDAVGFVVNSASPRLTIHQMHSFGSILSLFGHDVVNNIFMLLTFADGQKPQVLSSIGEAQVPYKEYIKFNNCALFVDQDTNDKDKDLLNATFWRMSFSSFKHLMKELGATQPVDLNLFRKVLKKRHVFQEIAEKMQRKIRRGVHKLEKLKTKKKRLEALNSKIEQNKRHTYEVKREIKNTSRTKPGQWTSTCEICKITCCSDCSHSDNKDKGKCGVMEHGRCTFYPKKCAWCSHKNNPFVITVDTNYVKETSLEMKMKYEKAEEKSQIVEQEIEEIQDDFEDIQRDTEDLLQQVRKTQETLARTALRPRMTNDTEYIDMLIINEQLSKEELGKDQRLVYLCDAKEKAMHLNEMLENDFDPFKNYKLNRNEPVRNPCEVIYSQITQ